MRHSMCGQKYRNTTKAVQNNKIGAEQGTTKYSQLIHHYFTAEMALEFANKSMKKRLFSWSVVIVIAIE